MANRTEIVHQEQPTEPDWPLSWPMYDDEAEVNWEQVYADMKASETDQGGIEERWREELGEYRGEETA